MATEIGTSVDPERWETLRHYLEEPPPDDPYADCQPPPTDHQPPPENHMPDQEAEAPSSDSPVALEDRLLPHELATQRARKKARQIIEAEERGDLLIPDLIPLDEFLAQPDDNTPQLIEGLWNVGTPVLFSAQYKAGKTTARDNVVRSLADGGDFLGKFGVQRVTEGKIVVLDLELSPDMMRRWLRNQGIRNQKCVMVLPMRGLGATLNLLLPEVRAKWADKLRRIDTRVLLLDCLRPVLDALALSEDKDAGRFLNGGFDPLIREAGIPNSMVIHHMGHNGERARGDSSMLGWGDPWKMVRHDPDDPASPRYFSAYGRDIEVPESLLSYDKTTRHLTIAGGSRKDAAADQAWPEVKAYIAEHPDCSANAIEKAVSSTNIHHRDIRQAISNAEKRHEVHIERTGKGKPNLHRLTQQATSTTSTDLDASNRRTHLDTSTPRIYDEVEVEEVPEAKSNPNLSRSTTAQSGPSKGSGIWADCGEHMTITEPGQTTHPNCDPGAAT